MGWDSAEQALMSLPLETIEWFVSFYKKMEAEGEDALLALYSMIDEFKELPDDGPRPDIKVVMRRAVDRYQRYRSEGRTGKSEQQARG